MAQVHQFTVEPDDTPEPTTTEAPQEDRGFSVLMLALKALSQRTLVALASLFTLITVGSAFWLFMVTPEPTTFQLIKLGMYGMFVLAANFIVRRK